jgi:hypothetical protein
MQRTAEILPSDRPTEKERSKESARHSGSNYLLASHTGESSGSNYLLASHTGERTADAVHFTRSGYILRTRDHEDISRNVIQISASRGALAVRLRISSVVV